MYVCTLVICMYVQGSYVCMYKGHMYVIHRHVDPFRPFSKYESLPGKPSPGPKAVSKNARKT